MCAIYSKECFLIRQDDTNFQGSPLFQATNNSKAYIERNNLSAAGWEDSSSYLGCVHEIDVDV